MDAKEGAEAIEDAILALEDLAGEQATICTDELVASFVPIIQQAIDDALKPYKDALELLRDFWTGGEETTNEHRRHA